MLVVACAMLIDEDDERHTIGFSSIFILIACYLPNSEICTGMLQPLEHNDRALCLEGNIYDGAVI